MCSKFKKHCGSFNISQLTCVNQSTVDITILYEFEDVIIKFHSLWYKLQILVADMPHGMSVDGERD